MYIKSKNIKKIQKKGVKEKKKNNNEWICLLCGSNSAARWYASKASEIWLLQLSYRVPRSYQTSER